MSCNSEAEERRQAEREEAIASAKASLKEAVQRRDVESLKYAIARGKELGLTQEVAVAEAVFTEVEAQEVRKREEQECRANAELRRENVELRSENAELRRAAERQERRDAAKARIASAATLAELEVRRSCSMLDFFSEAFHHGERLR